MEDCPFDDPPTVAVFTERKMLDGESPILFVSHDEEDGAWHFLVGEELSVSDARVLSLVSLVNRDSNLRLLADLPCRWRAWRRSGDEVWKWEKREEM